MARSLLAVLLLVAAPALADPPTPDAPPAPLAGYSGGGFFLRDSDDLFVLFPKGRLQIDWYNFLNRGDPPAGVDPNSAKDPRPKDTLFVRRARVELMGTVARHFEFQIGGEYGSVPATGSYGTLTDAMVNVNYSPWLQLQVGQFDAPFTLENRTSDKVFDFMERSVVVRAFGVPSNKEDGAMLWGQSPNKLLYYSLGLFDGDGQSFKNQDNNLALIGRATVAPFALIAGDRRWMQEMWVGGSIWWQKATNLGGAVAPNTGAATQNDVASMTTQGGFGFFSSSYGTKDAGGNTQRAHLTPDGEILKWALEANVPYKKLGLRFELVHQSMGLAEYYDSNPSAATVLRQGPFTGGNLSGTGYYVELFGWILGDTSYLDTPGQEPFPKMKRFASTKEPTWGLMLALKYEHVGFDVTTPFAGDPAAGHYGLDVLEFGANAWLTKHVRLTLNYVANFVGGFSKDPADAVNLTKNFYYGNVEHELLFRVAIGL